MSSPSQTSVSLNAGQFGSLDALLDQLDPASRSAVTEASTWLIWKNGEQWTDVHQQGLDRWLAESELNRFVYRYVAQVRERSVASVRRGAKVDVSTPRATARRRVGWAAAAAVVLAVVGAMIYFRQPGMATDIGEHRTVTLDDGTQVTLNTATRIQVEYSARQRRVELLTGEAYFNVSQRPDWPFVVVAGDREITALGTAFVVRHETRKIAVTLVEGKIAVAKLAQSLNQRTMPESAPLILEPGERLSFDGSAQPPELDRPAVEKLTAWRQGVVNIDNLTLGEAVNEMNRYNKLQLSVEGPAADIGVGGIFRSADAQAFAKALALTHGLSLRERDGELVLSGTPRSATDQQFDANQKGTVGN